MTLGYGFGYRSEQDGQENQGESVLGIHLRYCAHSPIYAAIAIASSSITVVTDSMLMKRYELKILESGVRRRRIDLEQQKEYDKSSTSLASTKYTTQDQQLQQHRQGQ